jgi:predicted TIM-barrel enzyme
MPFIGRDTALARLRARIAAAEPIIGAGAGTGISAKFAEKGGVDLIIIYNSGRFRMAGHGSLAGLLPFGDANAIVCEMAREVLPVVRDTPVLAGVCGTDPFRLMQVFLAEIKAMGFDGVQNFPTVGLIDGLFRQNLEETGLGYDREVAMIREAHGLGLLTCPYVFDPESAQAMTRAGADLLVAHVGLTAKGSIGAKTVITLAQAAERVQAMRDAAASVRPDIIVLCHGGPIADPSDVQEVLSRTSEIAGFFGASSIERLATGEAIVGRARQFRSIAIGKARATRKDKT